MSVSKIIVANSMPEVGSLTWVRPLGDADDHLRLAVILPLRLASQGDPDAAQHCLQLKLGWRERLSRLQQFLMTLKPRKGASFLAAIVDVDALYPGELRPESTWNDPSFRKERSEILGVLLKAFATQSWLLIRPLPDAALSAELPALEPGLDVTGTISIIPPLLRPLVKYLQAKKIVTDKTIHRIIKNGAEDPDAVQNIVGMVYDSLPRSARDAAKRASVVRLERPLNGVWGPFKIADSGEHTISSKMLAILREAGMLQAGVAPATAVIPNTIRHFLQHRAELALGDELRAEHEWLARQPVERKDPSTVAPEEELEQHHHAVAAQDFDLAKNTATYYGTDLRILAYRLSVAGQYEASARVYRYVIDHYDPCDAYSWEYYAFNLAQSPDGSNEQDKILKAYKRAAELAKDNPLYQGRLLGYRAQLGEDVKQVVGQASKMIAFYQMTIGQAAVSYYAEPVLRGLKQAKQHEAVRSLLLKFPFVKRSKSPEW